MTLALVAALFFAVADTADAPDRSAPPPDPGRQVVTRAEIEAAGLYRLPDLYRLIDGARTATVDGFAWRAHLGGGDPFGEEAWTLLLDGARVEFGLWGEQNLSLLPVAITHVDSVEVWTAPRFAAGRVTRGVIHIHTSRPGRGAAARGGFGIGNEVGDPGPYRYVPERSSRNVDKFGADYEALASYATPRVRAQARFKLLRFYATDPAAVGRNRDALGGDNPALRLFAPAVRFEADALGGTHAVHLLGGGSNDLWFFRPFGRELPVRRVWGQAEAHGRIAVRNGAVGYRVAAVESRLDEWSSGALGIDPQWRARTLRAGLDGAVHRGPWSAGLGGEVRRVTADGADGFTLGTVAGHVVRSAARTTQRLDATLAVAEEQAWSAVAQTHYHVGAWTVGATAAFVQRLPEEQERFGFWARRGYDASERVGVGVEVLGAPAVAEDVSLALDAVGRVGPGLTLEASAAVQRLGGVYREVQPVAPFPTSDRPTPRVGIAADGEGTFVRGRIGLRAERGRWSGRAYYDGRAPLGDSVLESEGWDVVPRHQAGVRAALAADPSFTVSGALTVRSAAAWPRYAAFDSLPRSGGGANDGLYHDGVPALWLLDAAAEKWFWQRRFRASLLFRNLLGQDERYHPIGAALDLRFYLRLELKLGP
jgi:hypothetical protein